MPELYTGLQEIDHLDSKLSKIIVDSESLALADELAVGERTGTKYDTAGVATVSITFVLLFIFFLAWVFRDRLLGEDDDPIHVFRDTRPRNRG